MPVVRFDCGPLGQREKDSRFSKYFILIAAGIAAPPLVIVATTVCVCVVSFIIFLIGKKEREREREKA